MIGTAIGIGALTASLAVGAHFGPQLVRRSSVRRLRDRSTEDRMVCLTFDDGPGPSLTPRVLALLARHGVRATFYMLGFRAEAAPGTANLVREAGHEVAAHTQRHLHAWNSMPWTSYTDVVRGYRTLAPWLSERARFRPPYGKLNIGSWAAAALGGAPIDWWTIDSGDTWAALPAPESVAERVVRERGGVVLLHDFDRESAFSERADFVLEATDRVINRARQAGLGFGTMSELMQRDPSQ